ncbi:hypothetical protein CLAFUW4_00223 [Fulvia fulva]|uniref:Uncharacterized protein n=1 Tax=Passalora fulva TaxID=5499 RepID=A0A9Q8P4C8_PASFU|nr:uncharacterized protein CLAFUR5_00224 [Fulvia fulva]KAK4634474.1 hypothetical protein CLAFUR4_00223 [Fulvia fulva]KAK4637059.1 hypothetical protein CLAFUR0_00224 [Fulvia fulva]UJO12838.1 hypothetical protein CLAFUR5_00224 [Fulvia fulva]WPV08459.1 hypothetical protein CLAFUW4_00223 [Fulvia fulva]WPV24919.1 hypothetical protein CLAFUW7_00227 [Fulvia fulva]
MMGKVQIKLWMSGGDIGRRVLPVAWWRRYCQADDNVTCTARHKPRRGQHDKIQIDSITA